MSTEESVPATEPAPARPGAKLPIFAGFAVGAVPWLLTLVPQRNYGAIPFLIFACFGMPVVALITALVRKSRRFGLGLLLATGLGWLILGAICGGLLRK
jgi:hypothetical protein